MILEKIEKIFNEQKLPRDFCDIILSVYKAFIRYSIIFDEVGYVINTITLKKYINGSSIIEIEIAKDGSILFIHKQKDGKIKMYEFKTCDILRIELKHLLCKMGILTH